MRVIRWGLALLVIVAAAMAAYCLGLQRCRCNIEEERAEKTLTRIGNMPTTPATIIEARDGVARMRRCVEISPTDIGIRMNLAGYETVIGKRAEALATYTEALNYDRRPEIFLNIGLLELQMNRREAAIQSLKTACMFNVGFVNEIPQGDREIVLAAVNAEQAQRIALARKND